MRHKLFIICLFVFLTTFLLSCRHDDSLKTQGYIEGRYTYIASSVSGDLEDRLVDRGQKVTLGDKLYALDPFPQVAELEEAEKDLIAEKENLIVC